MKMVGRGLGPYGITAALLLVCVLAMFHGIQGEDPPPAADAPAAPVDPKPVDPKPVDPKPVDPKPLPPPKPKPGPCAELQKLGKKEYLIPPNSADYCFYTIQGETAKVNDQKPGEKTWTLNVQYAREACEKNSGQLPHLADKNKRASFAKQLKESIEKGLDGWKPETVTSALVGLKQEAQPGGGYKYTWDDGVEEPVASVAAELDGKYLVLDPFATPEKFTNIPGVAQPKMNAIFCELKPGQIQVPPTSVPEPVHEACEKISKLEKVVATFAHNHAHCYFVVSSAVAESNTQTGNKFVFDKKKARDICQSQSPKATLAIVRTVETNNNLTTAWPFLKQLTQNHKSSKVALDLTQTAKDKKYEYKWETMKFDAGFQEDQPLNFKYEAEWENKFADAIYTYLDMNTGHWVNELAKDGVEQPVLVVCEQQFGVAQTPLQHSTMSKCLTSDSDTYAMAVYDHKHCLFHDKKKPYAEFTPDNKFNFAIARSYCRSAGGQLPTVLDQKEADYIMKNLDVPANHIVPLGLYQNAHVQGYWWNSSHELAGDLKKKLKDNDKYAYYTGLKHTGKGVAEWVNILASNGNDQVYVVCEQENVEVKDYCDLKSKNIPDIAWAEKIGEKCIFALTDIVKNTNMKGTDNKYKFDIGKAREKCDAANKILKDEKDVVRASLLSIRSREDINTLVVKSLEITKAMKVETTTNNELLFALGLQQLEYKTTDKDKKILGYTYKWEHPDVVYDFESVWPNKYEGASKFVQMQIVGSAEKSDQEVKWINSPEPSINQVLALCQQKMGEPPTTEVGKTRVEDRCHGASSNEYTSIMFHTDDCYFIVNGGMQDANTYVKDKNKFRFDIQKARRVCQKYHATLPVLESGEEYEWVADHYEDKDFANSLKAEGPYKADHGSFEKAPPTYIALGIMQTHNKTALDLWDHSLKKLNQPTWNPPNPEDKYAYFIGVLRKDGKKRQYVNLDTDYFDQPVAVICNQKVDPVTDPPTTPTTPKTQSTPTTHSTPSTPKPTPAPPPGATSSSTGPTKSTGDGNIGDPKKSTKAPDGSSALSAFAPLIIAMVAMIAKLNRGTG